MEWHELLARSCERVSELVELTAPTNLVVAELRILIDRTFDGIQHQLKTDVHRRLADMRRAKHKEGDQAAEAKEDG